ncbi:DMT family transporter [Streptomyces aureoverticillatus]|uniref:DMT family transporter n=1 Tax=Streptomyces aureoverticillatus TaxID=66871 RepID=UPI0013DD677D|nr:DMT family transporter [Streptomyces aureoverticillatus]QIB47190.1 DMT family transporter [Streptomyces aureoverticillatus]
MNVLLSIGFVLTWSSGFIGAKLGAGSADAVTVLMWRFLPLAAVLALLAATVGRASWRGLTARDLGRQAVVGALSQSGYLLTVYHAIQLGVSSGTTALIDGTQPLVAGALAGPLLGQYVSRTQWVGLALGLTGVAVVTAGDAAAGTGAPWWAYLVPFLGMLSLVAATFLDRRTRTPVAPLAAMTVHCVTSAVVFSVLALALGAAAPVAETSFWAAVGWLVVLSTFGGYGLYWLILRRGGVTRVNTLMFLMAPVTALWGAAMFGEPFGPQTVLGLAIGLGAVVVVHRGRAGADAGADSGADPGGHPEADPGVDPGGDPGADPGAKVTPAVSGRPAGRVRSGR